MADTLCKIRVDAQVIWHNEIEAFLAPLGVDAPEFFVNLVHDHRFQVVFTKQIMQTMVIRPMDDEPELDDPQEAFIRSFRRHVRRVLWAAWSRTVH